MTDFNTLMVKLNLLDFNHLIKIKWAFLVLMGKDMKVKKYKLVLTKEHLELLFDFYCLLYITFH